MINNTPNEIVNKVISTYGKNSTLIVRDFYIGINNYAKAYIIYNKLLSDDKLINSNILTPLMIEFKLDVKNNFNLIDIICKKYITLTEVYVEKDISKLSDALNQGMCILLIENYTEAILIATAGGEFRSVDDPKNESAARGTREGFVEKLDTNLSLIKRRISDKSLCEEYFTVGRRSSTKVAMVYINNLAEETIVTKIRERINKIDVDSITGSGMLEQYIEDSSYSIFPQVLTTERCDIIVAGLMDGKVSLIVSGTPYVLLLPAVFVNFFQAVEDYYNRTLVSSFTRIVRVIGVLIVIFLTPLYLTLIRYNSSLIPTSFLLPIAQSRSGIALPPFWEILLMELIIEFLREGGLRLPPKIAQTLSIVGGIIIGNAALQGKIASPSTLLVIGISTACSFLIPNYEMSLSIRSAKIALLFLADAMGFLGISIGFFTISVHLLSLKSFGVPYICMSKSDLKDIFIRDVLWKMKDRPDYMPNKDKHRQDNFRTDKEE